jgi:hypothetical protein
MKHLLLLFVLVFMVFPVNAQVYRMYQTKNIHNQLRLNTRTGEVSQIQDDGQIFTIVLDITPNNKIEGRYSLTKTENMWTYILLDKFSGKLWQIQFSVQGTEYMGYCEINSNALSTTDTKKFTIQPLTSMYQFYLINNENGDMWKFQWTSDGPEYRWIQKFN